MRSVCQQKGKGNLRHDNRFFVSDNVDPDRIKDNVILKNESLQEAYDKCFGKATADYNAKQKRKDRKITDYFQSVFGVSAQSAKANSVLQSNDKYPTKSFYEDIVQIGDLHDTGIKSNPKAAELAKQALIVYANGFEERNPCFHVFNSVIHMDEATPHLHIDYIPVANGYKRGMETQNGYNRALEQMGYIGADGFKQWREKERDVFREICKSYGLDPKPKKEEQSRGHTFEPDEYRNLCVKQRGRYKKQTREPLKSTREPLNVMNENTYNAKSKALQRRTEAVEDKEKQLAEREAQVQQKALENEQRLQQLQRMAMEIGKQIKIKNQIASLEDISADKQRDLPYVDIAE